MQAGGWGEGVEEGAAAVQEVVLAGQGRQEGEVGGLEGLAVPQGQRAVHISVLILFVGR